jgi:hypothetical protein
MPFTDDAALSERARNLGSFNGMERVLVDIVVDEAHLEVFFFNTNQLAQILASPAPPNQRFPISGGHRLPAGSATGLVQVTAVQPGSTPLSLLLVVKPIGDYSTYTLSVEFANIDPVFSELEFKFRPGCFTNDCAPEWAPAPPPNRDPLIDYLAKDYDSFRHTLITAMKQRVAGWTPTSEADLSVVLIDLISAVGDELSDYQDRVMNEAYLLTARKRVSLARHARLMDYHIYEGNQASTWLLLKGPAQTLAPGFAFFSGDAIHDPDAQIFLSRDPVSIDPRLDALELYTWGDTRPALTAGDTGADIYQPGWTPLQAQQLRDQINQGQLTHLLIQEHLNPSTAILANRVAGRDITKRQLLRLVPGAQLLQDPLDPALNNILRVQWDPRDQLQHDYSFTLTLVDGSKIKDVSLFHGNLVQVFHGAGVQLVFKAPEERLLTPDELHYQVTPEGRWGTLCPLPPDRPLQYRPTAPRGEAATRSTLQVAIWTAANGLDPDWSEASSLVSVGPDDQKFVVETDELGASTIRFGNGINGAQLPESAEVRVFYQTGLGPDGNVGADQITGTAPGPTECWNPFDVTDGEAPEPVEEIVRNAPEAYRARQLRAVTLADYVKRCEELPGVSRAAARYAWTGSWRTVRIAVDPAGTETLTPELAAQVAAWLEAVRLLGEDLEIRPPRFVPLVIDVKLCASPDFWPEDLQFVLEQEFSTGFTPDGRMGFFNPDAWSFGQALHASEIEGRAAKVPGIEHIIDVTLRRWDQPTPGTSRVIEVAANEIVRVHNDPDHMELGSIYFDIRGGRG